jgi:hypothetical protein
MQILALVTVIWLLMNVMEENKDFGVHEDIREILGGEDVL